MAIAIEGMAPLLQVFDMPVSIAFYRDVLDFDVVDSDRPGNDCDWAMLRRDGVTLMLNTRYEKDARPASPDAKRVAAHDDTCIYFGCPDVDAAYEHLRALGIEAEPPNVAPYGMKQLYLRDPDGYAICFQWPADPDAG